MMACLVTPSLPSSFKMSLTLCKERHSIEWTVLRERRKSHVYAPIVDTAVHAPHSRTSAVGTNLVKYRAMILVHIQKIKSMDAYIMHYES